MEIEIKRKKINISDEWIKEAMKKFNKSEEQVKKALNDIIDAEICSIEESHSTFMEELGWCWEK